MDARRAKFRGMRWLCALLLSSLPAFAQDLREVDLELFLAVDVSRSMNPTELEIQRRGYAEALRSPEVISAINSGLIGEIALTYVEWAGVGAQKVVVPWTLVDGAEAAEQVASQITAHFDDALRRTSISGALDYARHDMRRNAFTGLRRVIDISGDGPNNQGALAPEARDRTIADGITINGLPLMTQDDQFSRFSIPDLDAYYENCVVGGSGHFVLPVYDWDDFPQSVKRKLVLEIAGIAPVPRIRRAQAYNCEIGEQMWERFMESYDDL